MTKDMRLALACVGLIAVGGGDAARSQELIEAERAAIPADTLLANFAAIQPKSALALPPTVAELVLEAGTVNLPSEKSALLVELNAALRTAAAIQGVAPAPQVTLVGLSESAYRYILENKAPIEKVAAAVRFELSAQQQAVESGEAAGGLSVTGSAAFALLPYLMEAGLCHGNIYAPTGLICALHYGSQVQAVGRSVQGRLTDPESGSTVEMRFAPPGSDLEKIFEQVYETCSADALAPTPTSGLQDSNIWRRIANRLSSIAGSWIGAAMAADTKRDKKCFCTANDSVCGMLDIQKSKVIVIRLDVLEFAAMVSAFGWAGFAAMIVEVYGEAIFSANVQISGAESDSAFAHAAFAYTCPFASCIAAVIVCELLDAMKDKLACFDAYASRQNFLIRPNGGYAVHSYAACAATPKPYNSQAGYELGKQYLEREGFTFKNSPHHVAGGGPESGSSFHLNPGGSYSCTRSSSTNNCPSFVATPVLPLNLPDKHWVYRHGRVTTGDNDYSAIFAGFDFQVPTGLCGRARIYNHDTLNSETAEGDVFWYWHGEGHGVVTPDLADFSLGVVLYDAGGYPMPTVDVLYGQTILHAPVVPCGLLAPFCDNDNICEPEAGETAATCIDCIAPAPSPPPSCAPQTVSWLTYCSGAAQQTLTGRPTMVMNTNSGRFGYAQFQCNANRTFSYVSGPCSATPSGPPAGCYTDSICASGENWPCRGCPLGPIIPPPCRPPQCQQ